MRDFKEKYNMLNVELTTYGLDDTLKNMRETLNDVLGNKCSKQRKDEAIYFALGALEAIWNMVQISEVENEDAQEEGTFKI